MPNVQSTEGAIGRPGSIAGRAILALVLLIGFYALALAIAGGLLWLCYAMVAYMDRISIKLLILCFISACVILWSILPRIDRFIAPGPRLLPSEHPRLFREIQQVAAATGQAMPVEVYLEGDVNAWVCQRGGIMGIGSRRVMGLGLALMRVLNVEELRAVLAHEFGHYHGGDTKLGPWIYKTRSAIGRTIVSLGDGFLQKPFLWYGNLFLRITHAISRRQEFSADRLAATVVGREPLVSGLRKVHGAGMAYNTFWEGELVPVLSAGYRPPMAEGFARFMRSGAIAKAVDEGIGEELRDAKADPYDTHPPLGQRIAAVKDVAARRFSPDGTPAIGLLEDLPALERGLLGALAGEAAVARLSEATWEDVGQTVYAPMWRRMAAEGRELLAGLTPESLPELAASVQARGEMPLPEDLERRVVLAGAAVTVAALDAGASLECELGSPVAVVRDSVRVEGFSVVARLAKGELSARDWSAQCEALGIAGADLGAIAGEDAAMASEAEHDG